jgi:soluble lytic murein transglycosylase-like protein
MKFAVLFFLLSLAPLGQAGSPEYFVPVHRVSGIGVARDDLSEELISARTDLMIQSQTFGIMREQQALPGARRITSNTKLQSLFKSAAAQSGLPASLIEAVAYLESWGDPKAESPSGPRGIMQISAATARSMGLKVIVSTRYRVTREKVQLAAATRNRKARFKYITHRTPYIVTARDDRMVPDRAIPAAARYLAGMEKKFGGRDWAIFAYHCGQGCVNEMMDLTRKARGIPADQLTVPRMFFSCTPVWNRELYKAIFTQMQRDWSPTYYFRIMRAQQLLALYRSDPDEFARIADHYRGDFTGNNRPQHRLAIWLKRDDLVFHNIDDIRADSAKRLVKALDRPDYLGYTLRISPNEPANLEMFSEASPSALGALSYIAFETRRLFEEMKPSGESFQPLPVSSLVGTDDVPRLPSQHEALSHTSGQVFDIDYSALPPAEVECLKFVLEDLGWEGYLGFIEDGVASLHIGPSPESRDFFSTVFQESIGRKADEGVGQ